MPRPKSRLGQTWVIQGKNSTTNGLVVVCRGGNLAKSAEQSSAQELVERGVWGRAEDARLLVGGRDQGAVGGVPPGLPADGYRKVVVGLEAVARQSRHS